MIAWLRRLLWWRKPKVEPEYIKTNRAMRRNMERGMRLRGPGYTRPMRKGRREDRERPS